MEAPQKGVPWTHRLHMPQAEKNIFTIFLHNGRKRCPKYPRVLLQANSVFQWRHFQEFLGIILEQDYYGHCAVLITWALLRCRLSRKWRNGRVYMPVCQCWSLSPVRRETVEGEGENSPTNKGILSAPEAACAATSIPHTPSLLSSSPPCFSEDLLPLAICWAAQRASVS